MHEPAQLRALYLRATGAWRIGLIPWSADAELVS
jgi:hypothetical protein